MTEEEARERLDHWWKRMPEAEGIKIVKVSSSGAAPDFVVEFENSAGEKRSQTIDRVVVELSGTERSQILGELRVVFRSVIDELKS